MLKSFIVIFSVISLCGCASTVARDAFEDFDGAFKGVQDTVSKELNDRHRVERQAAAIGFLQPRTPADVTLKDVLSGAYTQVNVKERFMFFACAGLSDTAGMRAALGEVDVFRSTIDDLTEPASADLAELLASIEKYRDFNPYPATEEEGPLPNAPEPMTICSKHINDFYAYLEKELARPSRPSGRSISGVITAITALQALLSKLQELAVLALQPVDEEIRFAAFQAYVPHEKTVAMMKAVLGNDCVGDAISDPEKEPVKCSGGEITDAQVAEFVALRRNASLLVPFVQFVALEQVAASTDKKRMLAPVESVGSIHKNLTEFDTLRTAEKVEPLLPPLAQAYGALHRFSRGDLTDEQRRKAFFRSVQRFVGLGKALKEKLDEVKNSFEAARDSIDKLGL